MAVTRLSTPYEEFRQLENALFVHLLLYMLKPQDMDSTEIRAEIEVLVEEVDAKSSGIISGHTRWTRGIKHILRAIDSISELHEMPIGESRRYWDDLYFRMKDRLIPKSMMTLLALRTHDPNDREMERRVNIFLMNSGLGGVME